MTSLPFRRSRVRHVALVATICLSGLFAFFLPSSIGGEISRALSVVSIAGTVGLLLAAIVLTGRLAPPHCVAASAAMMALLLLFTVTSPFLTIGPGVVVIYLGLALLFSLNVQGVVSPAATRLFDVVTGASLVAGYALAFDVVPVDRLTVAWYSAFYRELVPNMVLLNKPVLSFATHSMAGFMIYVLYHAQIEAWRHRRTVWSFVAALGLLGLLVLLRSTTGQAFAVVAAAQLFFYWLWAFPRYAVATVAIVTLLVIAGATLAGITVEGVIDDVTSAIVGDRVRGLFSRYAIDGLLAPNMKYLSDSPLSPIGFSATETLYLGDSGLVVNLLRGSLPLMVAVYGGLWVFLRSNLRDAASAAWLWCSILLFEIGFTPLFYFRFVAFVPFLVLCLNTVAATRRSVQVSHG